MVMHLLCAGPERVREQEARDRASTAGGLKEFGEAESAMDLAGVSGVHDMDRYELLKDIGSGNFGVARLMRDKKTRELVAVKYIERGEKVRDMM